jgi:hypothetical protein
MDYKVRDLPQEVLDDAKPRNILEEIVWYKAREIEAWKERTPLPALMVSLGLLLLCLRTAKAQVHVFRPYPPWYHLKEICACFLSPHS